VTEKPGFRSAGAGDGAGETDDDGAGAGEVRRGDGFFRTSAAGVPPGMGASVAAAPTAPMISARHGRPFRVKATGNGLLIR